MVVHAVRKNVKKNWLNDRDQFLQPEAQPGISFVRQCAVWSLFADSNHTASLRNVKYEGKTFQILNQLFPFKVSVVKKRVVSDSEISCSLTLDTNRFAAKWLAEQKLDSASERLLDVGQEIYKSFFQNFEDLPAAKYKIEHWDAGWWQIRRRLVEAGLEMERLHEMEEIKKQLGAEINEEILHLGIISVWPETHVF